MNIRLRYRIDQSRVRAVRDDITRGSEPAGRFYILVAVSTMIASFGLVTNSTSVVIGAMLVAPLMTPIFGIALALVRGDTILLGKAIRAEVAGVVAAVMMGFILGHLYPALEPTPEMLSRTQPQLFDLLVAVLSGFAGAYALVDEHISPALPGVAIATAIVPPLANCGLCFSVGAYVGGIGSFLLFFANFLSILVVASATFWFFGMTMGVVVPDRKAIIRRFGLPVVAFVLVAAFLSHALYRIARDQRNQKTIQSVLAEMLSEMPGTGMDHMIYKEKENKLFVLANVHSSGTLSPIDVKRIQDRLSEALKSPAELIVRNSISTDVSAIGSVSQIGTQNLDGIFVNNNPSPDVINTKIADTVIRDFFVEWIGFELLDVTLMPVSGKTIVLATVRGFTPLSTAEIDKMEKQVREKINDPKANLVIRFIKTDLRDRSGPIALEWSGLREISPELNPAADRARAALRSEVEKIPNVFLNAMNVTVMDGVLSYFLEVTGATSITPEKVAEIEQSVSQAAAMPVSVSVWFRPEAVVSSGGYRNYEDVIRQAYRKQARLFEKEIQTILKR